MKGEIYVTLLHAIEELHDNIIAMNPNANIRELDTRTSELYRLVNEYDDSIS